MPLYYRAADCFVVPTRALGKASDSSPPVHIRLWMPVLGTPIGATPVDILGPSPRLVTDDATAPAIYRGMARFMDEVAAKPGYDGSVAAAMPRAVSRGTGSAGRPGGPFRVACRGEEIVRLQAFEVHKGREERHHTEATKSPSRQAAIKRGRIWQRNGGRGIREDKRA